MSFSPEIIEALKKHANDVVRLRYVGVSYNGISSGNHGDMLKAFEATDVLVYVEDRGGAGVCFKDAGYLPFPNETRGALEVTEIADFRGNILFTHDGAMQRWEELNVASK